MKLHLTLSLKIFSRCLDEGSLPMANYHDETLQYSSGPQDTFFSKSGKITLKQHYSYERHQNIGF